MAKLHFFYSTMNAGKSTSLLQSNHNYIESKMNTMLFVPKEFGKQSKGKIISRIGLTAEAIIVDKKYNFYKEIKKAKDLKCVFVDESQFLSKEQVRELAKVTDLLNIPVMCYGIRTDFRGELFEGSKELLSISDNLIELKTICSMCDKKAIMVVRLDENGKILIKGKKVLIGGNERYKSVCRKHFRELTNLV